MVYMASLLISYRHDEFKFGCTSLRVPPDLLYELRNDITVSPNGIAFVKVRPCLFHTVRLLLSHLGDYFIPNPPAFRLS